jgi:hypothetical protein
MGETVAHLGTRVLAAVLLALLGRVAWKVGGLLGVLASLFLWGTWAACVWLVLLALAALAAGR